jgi:hypothetical protein
MVPMAEVAMGSSRDRDGGGGGNGNGRGGSDGNSSDGNGGDSVDYIDNGKIWVSSLSLSTNTLILQAAYKTVRNWLTKNGHSIDTKKCELIYFTRRKKDQNNLPSIFIPNESEDNIITITPSPHIKWLVIIFDSKLNFQEYICKVTTKANSVLGGLYMLGNTMKGLSAHHFCLLYTQTICPIINYAAPVWFSGTASQIRALIIVQNKALRLISTAFHTSPTYALEIEMAIPPLDIHLETTIQNAAIRFNKLEK